MFLLHDILKNKVWAIHSQKYVLWNFEVSTLIFSGNLCQKDPSLISSVALWVINANCETLFRPILVCQFKSSPFI